MLVKRNKSAQDDEEDKLARMVKRTESKSIACLLLHNGDDIFIDISSLFSGNEPSLLLRLVHYRKEEEKELILDIIIFLQRDTKKTKRE